MKYYLILIFFVILSFSLGAQVQAEYCGFEMEPIYGENIQEALSNSNSNISQGITSLPITLTFLMKSDSTSAYMDGLEESIMDSISAHFLPIGIHFYLAESPFFIYEDAVYDYVVGENQQFLNPALRQNRINVVIANSVQHGNGGSICGIAKVFPNTVFVRYSCILSNSITHEIGHQLGLLHTHETNNGVELVNGSNCTTAGDLICDTPADPYRLDLVRNDCTWEGTYEDENGYDVHLVDANGDRYSPDISNLMSYYGVFGCRNDFTYQQSVVMHNSIVPLLQTYGYETPKMRFVIYAREDLCEEGYAVSARVEKPDSTVVYEWDFDSDGETDRSGIEVDFLYQAYGNYTVTLSMTNPDGKQFYQSQQGIITYQNNSIVAPFLDDYNEVMERNHVVLIEESVYKWNLKVHLGGGRVVAGDQIHINENSVMEYKVDVSNIEKAMLEFEYFSNTDAVVGGDTLLIELVTCNDESIIIFEEWGENLGTDGEYLPVSLTLPEVDSDDIRLRFTTKGDADSWHDLYIDNLQVTEEVVSSTDLILKDKLKIFPNPTNSTIQIQTDLNISKVQLMDAYGKIFAVQETEREMNLSHLPRGIYFVKVFFNGKIITNKILKTN